MNRLSHFFQEYWREFSLIMLIIGTLFLAVSTYVFYYDNYVRIIAIMGLAIVMIVLVIAVIHCIDMRKLHRYLQELHFQDKVEFPDFMARRFLPLASQIYDLHDAWRQEKKQLKTSLTESRVLFDTLPDTVLMVEKDLTIVRANNVALSVLGKNIVGQALPAIIPDERLEGLVSFAIKKRKNHMVNVRVLNDGIAQDYMVYIRCFPVHHQEQEKDLFMLIMHDVTESVKARQMVKDFVANASHEIRTPLTSIIGFVETLQHLDPAQEEVRQKFLSVMADQAQNMSHLVENLISLSRVEVMEGQVPTGEVELESLLKNAASQLEWMAKEKDMSFVFALTPLDDVSGDHGELSQVATNLIANAIKYGEAGTDINIVLERKKMNSAMDIPAGEYIRFSVTNHGEGIPAEYLPRITERFYRVDKVRASQVGGSGLGLAIVKHIIKRHRGYLDIESTVGETTCFSVYLPI